MTSEHKFKVGDRVKIDRPDEHWCGKVLGVQGDYLWVSDKDTNEPRTVRMSRSRVTKDSPTPPLPEKVWLYTTKDNPKWNLRGVDPRFMYPNSMKQCVELRPRQDKVNEAAIELIKVYRLWFGADGRWYGRPDKNQIKGDNFPDLRSAVLAMRPELAELVGDS